MVHAYELIVMIKPDEVQDTVKKLTEIIKKLLPGETSIKKEELGKKTLAYPIKKIKEANYFLFSISCDAAKIPELSQKLKTFEKILRFLLIRRK